MEGIFELGINPAVLIAQIVNVAILFTALYFLLFKKFLQNVKARKEKIANDLEEARRARADAEKAETLFHQRLEEIEREREETLAKAREEAKQIRSEMLAKAREDAKKEAERILAQERAAFEAERQKMLADMHKQVANLVLVATRKVIAESIDEQTQRELIDRVLSDTGVLSEIQHEGQTGIERKLAG